MKQLLLILFLLLLFIITAKPAEAHFLATDNNIGAVLHVDPNDEPVAGEQAAFFFEFKDRTNKFTPAQCNCTFEIDENGQSIYSQPLFQNNKKPSLSNASIFYTFPQRDVYQIKVVGKPLRRNAFQPFTLNWNFRVDQQVETQAVLGAKTNFFSEHFIHFLGLGILLLFFILYLLSNSLKKRTPKKKGGERKDDTEDFSDMY